ncbi:MULTISPECIES: hypothetical protein [unclassified Streptomyces]|uniref:hypothetical protein n=1 Tax=unclassified Streptomyces TaxID=2593676 RepID=UPI000F7A14FB|nr:hypothetical protein [Streptomyces sp. WAC01280]RSS53819.1 hypothetical protein EF909_23170 [Streptomyces sp. WAC01280]
MAHNPQAPYGQGQGPEGSHDPAGSTQMFRAFVDEGAPPRQQPQAPAPAAGPRIGLIVGVVAVIAVLAAVAWLALG